VARDRKRAKQRQQRRSRSSQRRDGITQPVHENVPGELEHLSGEVEEFDAALVSGARGEAVEPEPAPTREEFEESVFGHTGSEDGDGELDETDLGAGAGDVGAPPPGGPLAARPGGAPAPGPRAGGNRIANFLRASWAELQRVQWPDRRQVAQATGVVLGFVAIAGAYLGLADVVAQKVVDTIL
jgi:preprotein translocase subunit SecE